MNNESIVPVEPNISITLEYDPYERNFIARKWNSGVLVAEQRMSEREVAMRFPKYTYVR